jgi:ketosteroid isomerase-like protein
MAAILLLAPAGCQPAADTATADPAADEAAIREVLDGIVRTFNAGDYEAMFAFYEDDVRIYSPGAPDMVGKAAWRAALETGLPPGLTLRMGFDTEEIVIGGDLGYERGTFLLEGAPVGSDAMAPLMSARHIHIFRRQTDGQWKGWRLFENNSEATPTLPPAQ